MHGAYTRVRFSKLAPRARKSKQSDDPKSEMSINSKEMPFRGAAPLGDPGAKQQLSLERGACFFRHVHGASAREGTICSSDCKVKLLLARGAFVDRNNYFY